MLPEKSIKKLEGVNPSLASVIGAASVISPVQFIVTEGVRDFARQKMLVAAGKSRTLASKHLVDKSTGYGEAVDLCVIIDGHANWEFTNYKILADAVKCAAKQMGIAVEWGGDWATFKDGVHFQLKRG